MTALGTVAGLVLGVVATLQVAPPAAPPVPAATPSRIAVTRAVPRPVVAAPLGSEADRRTDQRAFADALRRSDDAARAQAMQTVGTAWGQRSDGDWMRRSGCSMSSGVRSYSPDGTRSAVGGDAPRSWPSGTRFRLTIFMAQPSDWTWVADGRSEAGPVGVIALGAGGSATGTAQYAEFETATAASITALDIRTSPATPVVWDLDSCVPD